MGNKGTISHNPMEVDQLAIESWKGIYDGATGNPYYRVKEFVEHTRSLYFIGENAANSLGSQWSRPAAVGAASVHASLNCCIVIGGTLT